MGTRSLTHVMDGNQLLVTIYRQYDGYPVGHGQQLVDFLKQYELVNGISDREAKVFNGMGCCAAQIVAHLKTEPGNIYLEPPGTKNVGEEYTYTLSERDGNFYLRVTSGPMTMFGLDFTEENQSDDKVIFAGPISEYDGKAIQDSE